MIGASGWIGSAVSAHLESQGDTVIRAGRGGSIDVRLDFDDFESIEHAVAAAGSDSVVYAAGVRAGPALVLVNVAAVGATCRAARGAGVKSVCVLGSAGVYGDRLHGTDRDGNATQPSSRYEHSKARGERAAVESADGGTRIAILRPANVIGVNDPRLCLLSLMRRLKSGRLPLGTPAAATNYVAIDDVAWSVSRVIREESPQTLTVSEPQSLLAFAGMTADALQCEFSVALLPRPVEALVTLAYSLGLHTRIEVVSRLVSLYKTRRIEPSDWLVRRGFPVNGLQDTLTAMAAQYRAAGLLD